MRAGRRRVEADFVQRPGKDLAYKEPRLPPPAGGFEGQSNKPQVTGAPGLDGRAELGEPDVTPISTADRGGYFGIARRGPSIRVTARLSSTPRRRRGAYDTPPRGGRPFPSRARRRGRGAGTWATLARGGCGGGAFKTPFSVGPGALRRGRSGGLKRRGLGRVRSDCGGALARGGRRRGAFPGKIPVKWHLCRLALLNFKARLLWRDRCFMTSPDTDEPRNSFTRRISGKTYC